MTPWDTIMNQLEGAAKPEPEKQRRLRTGFPGIQLRKSGKWEATGCIYSVRQVLYYGDSLNAALKARHQFEVTKAELLKEKEVL